LALALARRGGKDDYEKAISLLNEVIEGSWDIRFAQVEAIAVMDLNRVLHLMRCQGYTYQNQQNFKVDTRIDYYMDIDVRVVISWDADMVDVELQCVEPGGEICSSMHNRSKAGGILSKDFTAGYGPVEYMIRKARPGEYQFRVHLFSPTFQTLGGAITVRTVFYTNCGKLNEEERINIVRLSKPKETIQVGTVVMRA